MNKIDVKCVALEGAIIPEYKTVGAAGADVYAFLKESVTLAVGKSCVIPTGVFYEIPEGFEIENLNVLDSLFGVYRWPKVKNLFIIENNEIRLKKDSEYIIGEGFTAIRKK